MKTRAKSARIASVTKSESTQTVDEESVNHDASLSKSKRGIHTDGKRKPKRKRRRLVKENPDVTNQPDVIKSPFPEESSTVSSEVDQNTNTYLPNTENENKTKRTNEEQEAYVGTSQVQYLPLQLKPVHVQTVATFPTKRGYITSMVSNEPDKVWAVHNFGNIINCYTIDGKIENTLQLPVSVDDVTKCPDGSLLLTEGCLSPGFGKSKIWKIENEYKTAEPHDTISVSPLYARGIFCKNKNLYVCCVDTNTAWRDGTNRRVVVKMTNKGQTLKTMDTDVLGEYLFTQPYRLSVNEDGDIIVLDVQNVNQVKLVSAVGQLLGSFPGSSGLDRNVVDVCCDCEGYIYVSDTVHNCIDMLYPDGRFCRTILTRKQGINAVQSIVIDSSGKLWVGNYSEIKVFKVWK